MTTPIPNVRIHNLYANVYLLSSPLGRLLVDAGAWPYSARFDRMLRDFAPGAVLLTHAHVDHSGGAWRAARRGLPLLEHPQLTGVVHDLPYPAGRPEIGRMVSRAHPKVAADALHAVHPGEVVLGWEVVALPGHTPGQIGVLMDGVLVAADAVIGGRDGAHLPKAAYNADHAQARQTLQRMADMDLRAVLPGHGGPLTPSRCGDGRGGRRAETQEIS
ncbi:MBL fold metallo-hydrolase [Deinococcus frigens]|uniref:MBL fold metallo-hydrolase n=1 Tax=Deinococcus frigens TaxID=249403 RepID=UPI000A661BE0|nr:MBL fold metallo-hydrolase [Deinococcus frigens]